MSPYVPRDQGVAKRAVISCNAEAMILSVRCLGTPDDMVEYSANPALLASSVGTPWKLYVSSMFSNCACAFTLHADHVCVCVCSPHVYLSSIFGVYGLCLRHLQASQSECSGSRRWGRCQDSGNPVWPPAMQSQWRVEPCNDLKSKPQDFAQRHSAACAASTRRPPVPKLQMQLRQDQLS